MSSTPAESTAGSTAESTAERTVEYAVLLPGDEEVWARMSEEERTAVYERHREFSRLLEERGHTITGGAELAHSRTARTVRSSGGEVTVTEGPYAEAAEQLSGFYLVRSSDLEDLLQVCAVLADAEGGVEVRACVDHSADGPEDGSGDATGPA